ncbi:DUF4397 domain-containing protein [Pedobacter punctiformis]|uniref:DUF4397 domain-containing protein n=1 Tax=Pedobacter punctiformis TaxID=3004097 RepID=A0ABT4L9A1_9SPHI|nr:DUF4397 domain-containing protein [Pedobacter sp. HCMS5-2]MCZ4244490.1 DUF4397 domain-containing protein [Pedobacter sp. HCMS5-2]
MSCSTKSFLPARSIILLFVVFILSSCKKNDPGVVVKGEAKVKIVNAVQTESGQNLYVDDQKVEINALNFGETSDYLKIFSGSRKIGFKDGNNVATEAEINFIPSITYTTFLVSDRTGKKEVINFEDNLSNTENDKAKIKLINLTPYFNTGISVSVQTGTQFVNSLMYKEASNYFTVDTGLNLRFNVVGSTNIKTIAGTDLQPGKIYTIWFSGTTTATLEAHIITDN